ncbi:hypothetical protein [Succinatimonas hippei]|uniref:hypothetical protein n=1 Tax=Succinatimonas hippei TaxID=626938 RepID=UPI0023F8BEA5|nr:hypothetical protein [Succinatimonas hippei]
MLQFNAKQIEFKGNKNTCIFQLVLDLPQLSILELVFRLKVTSSIIIRKRKYPAVRAKLWGNALGRCLFCIIMHKSSDIYYSATY